MANAIIMNQSAPATVSPSMDGIASTGTSSRYAREDHIHPSDTSRASQSDLENLSGVVDGFTEDSVYTDQLFSTRKTKAKISTLMRVDKLKGFSFIFSQLVNNGTVTDTITSNHKYAVKNSGSWSIKTGTECSSITWASGDQCIDMTQIFGSGNEPSTIEAFREMFADSSYSYSVGVLKSGNTEVLASSACTFTETFPGASSGSIQLRRVGSTYDELVANKITQRIGTRDYQSGDESDPDVLTDGTTSFYILSQPVETSYSGYNLQIPVKPDCYEYLCNFLTAYPLYADVTYLAIDDSALSAYISSREMRNQVNNMSGVVVYSYDSTTTDQASASVALDVTTVFMATHVEVIYTNYLNGNDFQSSGLLPFKFLTGPYAAPSFTTTLRYTTVGTWCERPVSITNTYNLVIGSCKEYTESTMETNNSKVIVRQVKLYKINEADRIVN